MFTWELFNNMAMYYVVFWKSDRSLLYFECKECKNKIVDVYYKELSLPEDSTQVLDLFIISIKMRGISFSHTLCENWNL